MMLYTHRILTNIAYATLTTLTIFRIIAKQVTFRLSKYLKSVALAKPDTFNVPAPAVQLPRLWTRAAVHLEARARTLHLRRREHALDRDEPLGLKIRRERRRHIAVSCLSAVSGSKRPRAGSCSLQQQRPWQADR
jgi:hypothetical protein|eukprot:COSAG01_NODE_9410_length_2453_cov_23.903144_1_plen_135_part_00